MKIALSQLNTKMGDFDVTVDRMLEQAAIASSQGAEFIVFPLPVLTSSDPGGLVESEEYFLDLMAAVRRLYDALPIPALVPLVMGAGEGQGVCIEALLFKDDVMLPLHLLSLRNHTTEENGGVWHGFSFDLEGLRFAVTFDIEGLTSCGETFVAADVVIYLPTYCYNTNDESTALAPSVADGCFVSEASDANAWVVAVSAVGGYDEHVFCGGSFVMAPWGDLAWAAPSFAEALGVVDVDVMNEGPLKTIANPPDYQRIEHLWDALVLWTRDLVRKEGLTDAALLLEGDLGTSTLAVLLTDALGPTHVHALVVPTGSVQALEDARSVARNLRLEASELAMRDATRALSALGASSSMEHLPSVADVARLKLEFDAREHRWVMATPADKTALALEADTAHAGEAILAPFADVYRTDLEALARYRNTISPVIPKDALARFRVPELPGITYAGTTEEARLNAVDAILLLHIERGLGVSTIAQQHAFAELTASVLNRLQECERYRRALPAAPVVSDRTLAERSWPLGLAWHDHARDVEESIATDSLAQLAERMLSQFFDAATPTEEGFADVMEMLRDFGIAEGGEEPPTNDSGLGMFSLN